MNIVAFGGGTNSAAMIIGMWQRGIPIDLILFADTGGEQPHTYEFIRLFNDWLVEKGYPRIIEVHRCDKDGNRLMLEDECLQSGILPAIAYGKKNCSQKHKIQPVDKYCNNNPSCKEAWAKGEKINKYVGYDAGEARRIEHAKPIDEADKKYNKHYLLYDWGWTREKCTEIIMSAGLPKPGKSSCFFCPNMKKAEIISLFESNPLLFWRAVQLERNAEAKLKSVKGLGRKWSWQDFIEIYQHNKAFNEAQISLDDFMETPGGCICGVPCGCYDG